MIYSFSKSLTKSDIKYKFFAFSKLQVERLGELEENLNVTLKCPSDKSVYDTYIDTYGRLKATAFFNSHNWLTEGTMIDFEIDTDSKIVKINIDTENTNADEIFSEQELTPDLERIVRDFLADSIIKGKIDSLRLYSQPLKTRA